MEDAGRVLTFLFSQLPLPLVVLLLAVLSALLTGIGTRRAMLDLDLPPGRWPVTFAVVAAVISGLFLWGVLSWQSQSTPEVIPANGWREGRVLYHLSLMILLLIVTATDLRSYLILVWCCRIGIGLALLGAVISGQFQLAHVWVDWNAEIPQLRGPEIPAWLAIHPHWHGLAWSLSGMFCGVILTWLIRWLGSWVLGRNALGSGDILLMAMVGAYLGWQPVVVITALAPILAMGVGVIERLWGNRAVLPYGPFLALASLVVMSCWKWIWMAEFSLSFESSRNRAAVFAVRRFFGDPLQMLLIAGGALCLLIVLLGLLRIYKSLPTRKTHQHSE